MIILIFFQYYWKKNDLIFIDEKKYTFYKVFFKEIDWYITLNSNIRQTKGEAFKKTNDTII